MLKLLAKNEAIDRLVNYKVTKEDISSNDKIERPDGLEASQRKNLEFVLDMLDWSLLNNFSSFTLLE